MPPRDAKALSCGNIIWKRRTIQSRDVFPVLPGDNYRTAGLRPSVSQPSIRPPAGQLSPSAAARSGRRGSTIGRPRSVQPRRRLPGDVIGNLRRGARWQQASPTQDGRRRYAVGEDSIFVHFILLWYQRLLMALGLAGRRLKSICGCAGRRD